MTISISLFTCSSIIYFLKICYMLDPLLARTQQGPRQTSVCTTVSFNCQSDRNLESPRKRDHQLKHCLHQTGQSLHV